MNYEILEFRGMNGATPYHYSVIKVGESEYYRGYDEDKIKTTPDIAWASHIAPEFAEETVGFLQKFFDDEGKRKTDKVAGN